MRRTERKQKTLLINIDSLRPKSTGNGMNKKKGKTRGVILESKLAGKLVTAQTNWNLRSR